VSKKVAAEDAEEVRPPEVTDEGNGQLLLVFI
jgi:hypothetical protein